MSELLTSDFCEQRFIYNFSFHSLKLSSKIVAIRNSELII